MIIIIIIIISIINESYIMTCTVSFAPAATGLTGTEDTTTVWNLITLQHTEGRRRIMMKRKMDPLSLQHVQTTAVIRPAVTCSDILVQFIVFLVVISRSSKGKSLLLCSVYFQLLKKNLIKIQMWGNNIYTQPHAPRAAGTQHSATFLTCHCCAEITSQRQNQWRTCRL